MTEQTSTSGTAGVLTDHGIEVSVVRKIHEGRPNLLDHLANGEIALIVNTPSGKGARTDEGRIRASAGVGATLDEARVQRFDAELAAMLATRHVGEPMAVPHRLWVLSATAPGLLG